MISQELLKELLSLSTAHALEILTWYQKTKKEGNAADAMDLSSALAGYIGKLLTDCSPFLISHGTGETLLRIIPEISCEMIRDLQTKKGIPSDAIDKIVLKLRAEYRKNMEEDPKL